MAQVIKIKKEGKTITLSQDDCEEIVNSWYTNGMCPIIFQDENGTELDEILSDTDNLEIRTI